MKSLFLAPTMSEKSLKEQVRELRRFHSSNGGEKGAFADRRRALSRLVQRTRKRLRGNGARPEKALMGAFFESRVPFFIDEVFYDHELRTAGAIAGTKPANINGARVRLVDQEELTLLSVAALRRLGEKAMFALMIDTEIEEYIPLILLFRKNRYELMQASPHTREIGENQAIEVLGDEAAGSLVHFNKAIAMNKLLAEDIGGREPLVPAEWRLRGMALAHITYEAACRWTVEDTRRDISISRELFGIAEAVDIVGLRQVIENNLVARLRNAFTYSMRGIMNELGIDPGTVGLAEKNEYILNDLKQEIWDETEDDKLLASIDAMAMTHFHMHHHEDCEYLKRPQN